MEVQVENFVNPVTGEEQDTKIQMPKGFIFKVADAAKTKIMRILTPNLNFDHSGKNAFYTTVEFKGPWTRYMDTWICRYRKKTGGQEHSSQ